MTLTECRGLTDRQILLAIVREDQIALDNALADGDDIRRDLIREHRPRRNSSELSS